MLTNCCDCGININYIQSWVSFFEKTASYPQAFIHDEEYFCKECYMTAILLEA